MGPAHQSEFLGTNYSQTRAESISCNKEFDWPLFPVLEGSL